jgi:hypothetical protein
MAKTVTKKKVNAMDLPGDAIVPQTSEVNETTPEIDDETGDEGGMILTGQGPKTEEPTKPQEPIQDKPVTTGAFIRNVRPCWDVSKRMPQEPVMDEVKPQARPVSRASWDVGQ